MLVGFAWTSISLQMPLCSNSICPRIAVSVENLKHGCRNLIVFVFFLNTTKPWSQNLGQAMDPWPIRIGPHVFFLNMLLKLNKKINFKIGLRLIPFNFLTFGRALVWWRSIQILKRGTNSYLEPLLKPLNFFITINPSGSNRLAQMDSQYIGPLGPLY